MTDDMIERVARAIKSVSLVPWERIEPRSQADYWFMARAAIAAMPGWQPIETAPRDGTKFLGVTKSGRMKVDWFDVTLSVSQFAHERGDNGYTHWMPLPEPPK